MGAGITNISYYFLRRIPTYTAVLLGGLIILLSLTGCLEQTPQFAARSSIEVTLAADGQSRDIVTTATSVRELLQEAGVTLNDADEVQPPLFTPLTDNLLVTVVRVTESLEVIEQTVPFDRKIVRSEAMTPDDPPVILQAGQSGIEELTVRIVYRDGLESERRVTQTRPVSEAQDEVVMIGVGAATGNLAFSGLIAYLNGGAATLLCGNTAFPEQLATGSGLDGRVFQLSPTGSHLLFTRAVETDGLFNRLYVISTEPGDSARYLGVDNVLWAGWNPGEAVRQEIAYTTGVATSLPPGWEANNDLWIGEVLRSRQSPFTAQQLVEAYPATYGWWGGNYAWSPSGRYIAYAYADEVGILDLENVETPERIRLQRFTEYSTGGDWVWVPSLSWSPGGRYLAFSNHGGADTTSPAFDTWVIDVSERVSAPFAKQTGMWAHPNWSPNSGGRTTPIAYLQATIPLESERSSYTLWLMDQDGSNTRQIFPPPAENSRFPRDQQFMAWGPTGRDIAFVFNDKLHIFNLDNGLAHQVTQDDAISGDPSWAPYGSGIDAELRPTEFNASIANPTPLPDQRLLPNGPQP